MTLLQLIGGLVFVLISVVIGKKGQKQWRLKNTFNQEPAPIRSLTDGMTGVVIKGTINANKTVSQLFTDYENPVLNSWTVRSGSGSDKSIRSSGFEVVNFELSDGNDSVSIDPQFWISKHSSEEKAFFELSSSSDYISIDGSNTKHTSRRGKLPEHLYEYVKEQDPSYQNLTKNKRLKKAQSKRKRKRFESQMLTDGDEVYVYGNTEVRQGDVNIIGTEKTPLIITNKSPKDFNRSYFFSFLLSTIASLFAFGIGAVLIITTGLF